CRIGLSAGSPALPPGSLRGVRRPTKSRSISFFGGVFASLQHGRVLVSVMEQHRDQSVRPRSVDAGSAPPAQGFDSTQWSVVVMAQDCAAPQARAALTTLCQTYWYPMYAYIRRRR